MSARSARLVLAAVVGLSVLGAFVPAVAPAPDDPSDARAVVGEELRPVSPARATSERVGVWAVPVLGGVLLLALRPPWASVAPALFATRRRVDASGGVGRRAPPA
jgi:hypothetical protein